MALGHKGEGTRSVRGTPAIICCTRATSDIRAATCIGAVREQSID
jgi:hypothetical protein